MNGSAKILVPVLALLCFWPAINAGEALLFGVFIALVFGNPYLDKTKAMTKTLLSFSVIGLGAGMNLIAVAKVGLSGLGYTAISIALVMGVGLFLGRMIKSDKESSLLIAVGTAICGGSAIAAVAPVIDAKAHNITVAMAVVFILNAVALLVFPAIGHHFGLSEHEFGLWSALAIHDTSSVVGAGSIYGPIALETGTTVKLARALWIVPMVLVIQYIHQQRPRVYDTMGEERVKPKPRYPFFILGFLAMAGVVTYIPSLQPTGHVLEFIARRLLVVTLFLIGANLTREAIREVGVKPLMQGMILWVIVTITTFVAINAGVIR